MAELLLQGWKSSWRRGGDRAVQGEGMAWVGAWRGTGHNHKTLGSYSRSQGVAWWDQETGGPMGRLFGLGGPPKTRSPGGSWEKGQAQRGRALWWIQVGIKENTACQSKGVMSWHRGWKDYGPWPIASFPAQRFIGTQSCSFASCLWLLSCYNLRVLANTETVWLKIENISHQALYRKNLLTSNLK